MAHDLTEKIRTTDVLLRVEVDFSDLMLSEELLTGLKAAGFENPSPIQIKAIPAGRSGKDLWIQAKSGTGKTLMFVIVALELLIQDLHQPQALILAPTWEIAKQINSVIKSVSSSFPCLTSEAFIGGTSVREDILKVNDCQIVIGTPGRIKSLLDDKALNVQAIKLLILDEADRLVEVPYLEDIWYIFIHLAEDKQVIVSSATYPEETKGLVNRFLKEPIIVHLDSENPVLIGVAHYAIIVKESDELLIQYEEKAESLKSILMNVEFTQCLVFCHDNTEMLELVSLIKSCGFSTTFTNSSLSQADRLDAMEDLKTFKCKIIVSNDLVPQGLLYPLLKDHS